MVWFIPTQLFLFVQSISRMVFKRSINAHPTGGPIPTPTATNFIFNVYFAHSANAQNTHWKWNKKVFCGKFTWIEREFNACQTPRSMYPSIFNRFSVIQAVSLKVRNFSTFFAHFGLPWDNRGKCYMDGKRIQCLSMHRSMYPSIFNRFPVI